MARWGGYGRNKSQTTGGERVNRWLEGKGKLRTTKRTERQKCYHKTFKKGQEQNNGLDLGVQDKVKRSR